MKYHIFFLFVTLLLSTTQCTNTNTYTTTDNNGNTKPNYVGIIGILAVFAIQLILCFICYKNTQRIRVEAQTLRTEIGAEYDAIKNAQFSNMNQACQFNYYLVFPNDPRFQCAPGNYSHPL